MYFISFTVVDQLFPRSVLWPPDHVTFEERQFYALKLSVSFSLQLLIRRERNISTNCEREVPCNINKDSIHSTISLFFVLLMLMIYIKIWDIAFSCFGIDQSENFLTSDKKFSLPATIIKYLRSDFWMNVHQNYYQCFETINYHTII